MPIMLDLFVSESTAIPLSLDMKSSRVSAQKRVNDLLDGMFSREHQALHSLTGVSKQGVNGKPAIDKEVVACIIGKLFVMSLFI